MGGPLQWPGTRRTQIPADAGEEDPVRTIIWLLLALLLPSAAWAQIDGGEYGAAELAAAEGDAGLHLLPLQGLTDSPLGLYGVVVPAPGAEGEPVALFVPLGTWSAEGEGGPEGAIEPPGGLVTSPLGLLGLLLPPLPGEPPPPGAPLPDGAPPPLLGDPLPPDSPPPPEDPTEPLQGLVTSPLGLTDLSGEGGPEERPRHLLIVDSGGELEAMVLGGACEGSACYAGRRLIAAESRTVMTGPDGSRVTTSTVLEPRAE